MKNAMLIPRKYMKIVNNEQKTKEEVEHIDMDADIITHSVYINDIILNTDGISFERIIDLFKANIEGDDENEPIPFADLTIHINSYGGDLFATLNIIAQIEELQAEGIKVTTIAKEKCMSGGCMILLYGDKRLARRYSRIMFHPALISANSQDGFVDKNEVMELLKTCDEYWDILKNVLVNKTKLTDKKIKEIYKDCEDYTLTVEEALRDGFIDGIL